MTTIYRFGDFELDTARFELKRAGISLDVQPKVLRLLQHLIEQRARAVPTDELMRVLWPDTRVGAGSIKRAVLGARQALDDRGEDQSSIRTLRGFGYQFVREVTAHEPPAPRARELVLTPPRTSAREALLGRQPVMELLDESLHQALAGSCRIVLLTGGPGLGKSRVLEELLADAEQLGAEAWVGRCTEVEGAPAFWPFIQVMREALRRRGGEAIRALLGSEGADLAGAFSELRDHWPDLPEAAPLSSTSGRFRLYDSMAVFLQRAAAERPIVLALDDLHRADPASLRLLAFVVRYVQHARLLILAAMRPEISSSPEALQLLEELKSAARCVALPGLSPRDIARYVQLACGAEPPASVCELLHEQTAGNPLFLQHLVENWRARTEDVQAPSWPTLTSAPLSAGVSGAIERHLELVSQPCRELLRAAAVLGTELSVGVLMRVAEHDAISGGALLTEAVLSGLVRPVASEHGGLYRFAHVLVRDALYAQLSAAKRNELHLRAARALATPGVTDNAVLLAEVTRHSVQAAALDPDAALKYSIRAAELDLRTLAYEQAAAHFDGALSLLQYRAPDPGLRMSLLFRKGDALARIDLPAARAALFEAAALARELGDTDHLVRSAMVIASRPESGTVDAPQVEVLRQALAMLVARDERDERIALLEALLAKSLLYELATDERPDLARSALARARALRGAAQRAEVLTRCHEALPGPEHQQERLQIANELMSLAVGTDDPVSLMNAFAARCETCVERGDMDGVDRAVESIDVLAGRAREPYYRWYTKVIRAMRDFVRGDIAASERLSQDAWQNSGAVSTEFAQHTYRVQRHAILRMRGQLREAEPVVHEMMLMFPAVPGWTAAWGAIVWDLGQHDAARDCLQRMMTRGAEHIRGKPSGLANCAALAELCCKVGDRTAAREIYETLAPFGDYQGFTTMGGATFGPLQRHLGTLAECLGQMQLAEAHYHAALEAAARMRSPVFISGTSYVYARMLLVSGDASRREQAADMLANAWHLADRHQLHSIGVIAARLATRHGLKLSNAREDALPQGTARTLKGQARSSRNST